MNAHRVLILALAAALNAPAFAVPPPSTALDNAPAGYYVSKLSIPTWNYMWERMDSYDIAPGVARKTVESKMGQPKQMLSPDVWLYENCQPNYNKARIQGCTLLVITFSGQSVSEMKFVNRPLATQIAAQLEAARSSYALGK